MKSILKIFVITTGVILLLNNGYSQITPARVEVGLNFSDNSGGTLDNVVAFGLDPAATDGSDGLPFENALPPFPPSLEVRFVIGAVESYTDIKNAPSFPFTGSKTHALKWQLSPGANTLNIDYDLPAGVSIEISTLLVPTSGILTGKGTYTLPNSNIITQATLTASYQNIITDVSEVKSVPLLFDLAQNYPNPFNPSTKIKYSIPAAELIQLNVYDLLGNKVASLVNEIKPAGSYEVEFQSTVGSRQLTSGIYFYQLQAGDKILTHKMTLLK